MNRLFTSLGAGLVLGMSALSLHAQQNPGLPVTEHDGHQCYYYTSKGGESVFGILNRFGWDEELFLKFNPGSADIKKGDVLYYPLEESVNQPVPEPVSAPEPKPEPKPEVKPEPAPEPQPEPQVQPTPSPAFQPGPQTVVAPAPSAPLPAGEAPAPEIYQVPEGTTLYQLARSQGTTVAQLFKLNPGLQPDRLKEGMTLRITPGYPAPRTEMRSATEKTVAGTRSYKVGNGDTWESIAAEARVPQNLLLQVNPGTEAPEKGKKINIPLLQDTIVEQMVVVTDPREESADGRRAIYNEVHGLPLTGPLEVTVITGTAADNHKRDNEFVRGMLLAVEELKRSAGPLNLHVRRMDPASLSLKTLEADSLLSNSRVIITTFDRDFPAPLAEFADAGGKQLINVFDAKSNLFAESPSLVQVLPPSADFYASCTDFLMAAKSDSHFLYVAEDDADGDCVSLLLLERLIREGKSYETVPGYADIANYNYKPGQSYVIVSDLNKRADIAKLLADVEKIIDKNPAVEISVIGRPTWVVYADALKSAMQKADTYIPSRFYMDPTEPKVAEFEKTFAENFGAAPVKSFPGYAAMGYDIAHGLLPILAGSGELTDTSSATGALQLDLSLSRRQPWNGLLNSVVYLVHLTPYNTVDKIRL